MTSKAEYRFYSDGTVDKIWKNENGQVHREDGPAYEYADGARKWCKNGKFHREDGPAVVWESGSYSYYLNGNFYTKEEYWKEIEGKERKNDFKSKLLF